MNQSGFTLIELLVVIGVIAVLAGSVGVGLAGGNQATDLTTGREILRSYVVAARQQAALNQQETALLVVADINDPERYLRRVAVATLDPESGNWQVTARGASLPGQVWVLPPVSGSSLLQETEPITLEPGTTATSCYLLRFAVNGQIAAGGTGKLWVGIGQRDQSGLSFPSDAPKVGLSISRYGAISMFDDSGGVAP